MERISCRKRPQYVDIPTTPTFYFPRTDETRTCDIVSHSQSISLHLKWTIYNERSNVPKRKPTSPFGDDCPFLTATWKKCIRNVYFVWKFHNCGRQEPAVMHRRVIIVIITMTAEKRIKLITWCSNRFISAVEFSKKYRRILMEGVILFRVLELWVISNCMSSALVKRIFYIHIRVS